MADFSWTVAVYAPPSPDVPYLVAVIDRLKGTIIETALVDNPHRAQALAHDLAAKMHTILAEEKEAASAQGS